MKRVRFHPAIIVTFVVLLASAGCDGEPGKRPDPRAASAGPVAIDGGIVYREVDGASLMVDVYRLDDDVTRPAVVLIHGGGWRADSRKTLAPLGRRFAAAGLVAVVPDYRLAPPRGRWHAPAPIDDLRAAMLWTRSTAATYGIDPDNVGALGSSAGANLALLLATTGEPHADKPEAVVSWSGPVSLRSLTQPALASIIANYIGCPPTRCSQRWIDASPIQHVDPSDPPTLLFHSRDEFIPVGQAILMDNALEEAGVEHELVTLEGKRHGLAYQGTAMGPSIEFLKRELQG